MSSRALYRAAAILLLLFAAGHTVGFLTLQPPTAEARAAFDAMNTVHFPMGRSSLSYGGFYRAFGLMVTVYLLFSALVAWQLGSDARSRGPSFAMLGWALCATQVASLVLSWIYFALPQMLFSGLIAACLAGGTWLAMSEGPTRNAAM